MDTKGLLLCARYAVAPNFFGYCGPDENKSLIDHLKDNIIDKEVQLHLSEFETLYPYLQLIAKENHIDDPFDKRVVEAYWVGNALLHSMNKNDYVALLRENLQIEKKIESKKFVTMKRKMYTTDFYPHHSFHVLNIFKRTGHDPGFHTLETMNECKISFGKMSKKMFFVETQPLIIKDSLLALGNPVLKEVKIDYKGKSFFKDLKPGDWVSFHWGFICDVLSERQVKNLEYYTNQSVQFYNS